MRAILSPAAERLTMALALASLVAGALTTAIPEVLTGTAVMNGSARGTGLVVAAVGVPALLLSATWSHRGSLRAASVCVGVAAYLTYNAVMFCFATPLNELFPAYLVMLGAGVFLLANAVPPLAARVADSHHRSLRWVGAWILTVVALNGALWVQQVLGAVLLEEPTDALAGTGLTTNPVWVQDLAVWLPAMAWLGLGAVGVLRARPTLVTAGLVFWLVEALGVAVDQWWGHRADPSSAWASTGAVWLFLATALIGLLPLAVCWRRLPPDPRRHVRGRRHRSGASTTPRPSQMPAG
jgi:hypothetical protein